MKFSKNWRNWLASIDEKTCRECRRRHGKIYSKKDRISPRPPLHPYCRCVARIPDFWWKIL